MPIYEYQCQSCGHIQEALQKMSDEPLVICNVCQEPQLKKIISQVSFRLKGQGWYETDFKSDNQRNVVNESEQQASSDTENSVSDQAASDSSDASGDQPQKAQTAVKAETVKSTETPKTDQSPSCTVQKKADPTD